MPPETSRMHCSGGILAHSSAQTVFESSVLSIDVFNWIQVGQLTGPLQRLSFLSLKPIESFLGCVFGISVLLKCPPSFHLQHPGGWQRILIESVSVHFSFQPGVQLHEVCRYRNAEKQSHAMMFPPPKLHRRCSVFGVCYDIHRCHSSSF